MSGVQQPTAANPYGLTPSLQAFMNSLQNLGNTMGNTMPNSSNYMRPSPPPSFNAGTPNSLLEQILQMRQAQAQGLAQPYQAGIAPPRVSLLNG
jgi:hypothetical protein